MGKRKLTKRDVERLENTSGVMPIATSIDPTGDVVGCGGGGAGGQVATHTICDKTIDLSCTTCTNCSGCSSVCSTCTGCSGACSACTSCSGCTDCSTCSVITIPG